MKYGIKQFDNSWLLGYRKANIDITMICGYGMPLDLGRSFAGFHIDIPGINLGNRSEETWLLIFLEDIIPKTLK